MSWVCFEMDKIDVNRPVDFTASIAILMSNSVHCVDQVNEERMVLASQADIKSSFVARHNAPKFKMMNSKQLL